MSFASQLKLETINSFADKSQCCRRAVLEGILASAATLDDKGVLLSLSDGAVVAFTSELIREVYSKVPDNMTSCKGGRRRMLHFSGHSAEKYVRSVSDGVISHSGRCDECHQAFLSGLFLARGRVSNAEHFFELEFSFGGRTNHFIDYFECSGLSPKKLDRKGNIVLYFKRSEDIEAFFAMAGMNNVAFDLMNQKIKREIRNNVNRISTCETNNIKKAVATSAEQTAVIDKLVKTGLISYLPDELQATAHARMENSHLSLSQLASIMTPPISKPGLSHRLKKIMEMAEDLLHDSKNK